jgi:hypothetical protein
MIETLKIVEPEIGSPEWKNSELDERFNGLQKMLGSGALAAELSEDRKSIIWRTASDRKIYCVDSVDILFPPFMIVPRAPERTPVIPFPVVFWAWVGCVFRRVTNSSNLGDVCRECGRTNSGHGVADLSGHTMPRIWPGRRRNLAPEVRKFGP